MTPSSGKGHAGRAWARAVKNLSTHDRASCGIQAELNARGISTLRIPRSTVLGMHEGAPVDGLVFKGSESSGTTLAGGSLAAHVPTVHRALARRRLPTTQGGEYSTNQLAQAEKFAEAMGYPVLVRPANSPLSGSLQRVVMTPSELSKAFKDVAAKTKGRVVLREKQSRSAWVQKVPAGRALRIFVVGDRVVGVANPIAQDLGKDYDSKEGLHPDIADAAVQAIHSVPGLSHGEVELVITGSATTSTSVDYYVMGINPSPNFDAYGRGATLGGSVLSPFVEHFLDKSGMEIVPPVQAAHRIQICYTGVISPEQFADQLSSRAVQLNVQEVDVDFASSSEDWVCLEARIAPEVGALLALTGLRIHEDGERASKALTRVVK